MFIPTPTDTFTHPVITARILFTHIFSHTVVVPIMVIIVTVIVYTCKHDRSRTISLADLILIEG